MKRMTVVIYARFSTDKQDARSIDDQVRRCRKYATEHGYKVREVYADAAASGGHIARAQLKRLLGDAKARVFEAVLVDDQSRLARDLGGAIGLIFTELPAVKVALIDCATGRSSTEKSARTLFAVNAIVNDAFLEMVKHETHRGMEGRAIAGFATGGRAYGYTTRPEENPTDPERVRAIYVIEAAEARIVVRIFRMWLDGLSAKVIAATLNEEGIAAPHDSGKGNKGNRGWIPGTIANIVRSERYIGRLIWNQREWVKNPATGKRSPVKRPREEWTITDRPELAIIDRATFKTAQERFRKSVASGAARVRCNDSIVSGLLRCGVCGGSLTTVGGTTKNGKRYRTLGCTTHWTRGESVCKNGLTVSEIKATASVIAKVKEVLTDPEVVNTVVRAFQERLAEASNEDEETAGIKAQIAETDKRLRNFVEGLGRIGFSEAIQVGIKQAETELAGLRSRLAKVGARQGRVVQHPNAMRSYVRASLVQLTAALEADDKGRARALLQEHVGQLTFTPNDGRYEWTGGLIFGGASISTTPAEGESAGVIRSTSSGGRI